MKAKLVAMSTFVTWFALTAPAWAREGGEGLYGKTNDKVITNFGFGLIIFFPLLVLTLSLAQHFLSKRRH